MSERITDALENGNAGGIGCTLEGFGINRWMFEYTLSRAWDTGVSDDDYLHSLDRRHHSPDGFWKNMADSIYLRGSFSEGPLICDRPCPEKWSSWRVINSTPYKPEVLERAFRTLVEHGGNSRIYRADIAEIGCQVLGNRFLALRDRFTEECRSGSVEKATETASEMRDILSRADALGYNGHFASAFPFAGGAYGNGVVSAGPVLKSFTVPLPQLDGSEPRSIAVVETEDMVFASTHLDFKASYKEQASVVNEWFSTNYSGYDKPVILCGDMNSLPESDTIRELEKCWTRLSGTEPTYSTENPHGCIDYILHLKGTKPVEVVSAGVIDTGVSDLSDHLPVKVTLEEKD